MTEAYDTMYGPIFCDLERIVQMCLPPPASFDGNYLFGDREIFPYGTIVGPKFAFKRNFAYTNMTRKVCLYSRTNPFCTHTGVFVDCRG
jgi:hypothetical protein